MDMRTRFTTVILALAAAATLPTTALAAECVHDNISPEQQAFLDQQNLQIRVPEGELAVIQRCDTNGDNVVDMVDIRNIALARNQPARHPDDPMDWDKNNVINLLDARGCQQACAQPRCAPMPPQPDLVGGVTEEAECSQLQDLDGDGSQDFVGIFEHTGEAQAGGYNLKLVLVNKDANGNLRQTTVDFAGEMVVEDGQSRMKLHVSEQPPGEVNLSPGKVTLENPGIVTYGYGNPEVIYYWADGQLRRGFYNIDD
jgi:hypothetical protein